MVCWSCRLHAGEVGPACPEKQVCSGILCDEQACRHASLAARVLCMVQAITCDDHGWCTPFCSKNGLELGDEGGADSVVVIR